MRPFADPESSFSGLSAKAVADLIAGGADLALVVDEKGVICDVACGSDDLANERWSRWLGQPLIQTVTVESRPKIEALLRDVRSSEGPRWRQVNHPSHEGPDLPLTYFAIPIEDDKRMPPLRRSVFFGRDLRALSALQQSLVNAQQEALQDHWKLRDAQSRNRHLFQTASDGVLIVDAVTQKIIEANPAAMALYVDRTDRLTGSTFPIGLDENDMHAVQNMLASVRTNGRSDSVRAQLNGAELNVSASLFRQESGSQLVVRMTTTLPSVTPSAIAGGQSVLLKLVKSAPDCMVVTDPEGLIVSANDAFLELVHLTAESQVRGESLGRWLGRTGVELNVLIGTLRQRGSIRLFPTHLRDDHGAVTDIEVSATQAQEGGDTFLGFTIRDISRRPTTQARGDKELPRSASQLAELVGRVPMKDIVGETTDLIEQLCIEAALDLTRDNRAAAAEMLGLSRQSLYVKLRRYGLSEPVAEGEK